MGFTKGQFPRWKQFQKKENGHHIQNNRTKRGVSVTLCSRVRAHLRVGAKRGGVPSSYKGVGAHPGVPFFSEEGGGPELEVVY